MALTIIEENTCRSIQRACHSIVERNNGVSWRQRHYEMAKEYALMAIAHSWYDNKEDACIEAGIRFADNFIKKYKETTSKTWQD